MLFRSEEEDHSQVRPPPLPVLSLAPGLYPTTRSPDEYPNFPAAYPLSPVGPVPPPEFQIVAPVPKHPSDVIDINNMSSSGRNNSNEPETRPGFHRSFLLSRECHFHRARLRMGAPKASPYPGSNHIHPLMGLGEVFSLYPPRYLHDELCIGYLFI